MGSDKGAVSESYRSRETGRSVTFTGPSGSETSAAAFSSISAVWSAWTGSGLPPSDHRIGEGCEDTDAVVLLLQRSRMSSQEMEKSSRERIFGLPVKLIVPSASSCM